MKKDLTGKVFGRLTVVSYKGSPVTGHTTLWMCRCSCGKEIIARANNIQNGHTKSCGCYQKENQGKHSLKHGHTVGKKFSRTYSIWAAMKARCQRETHEHYRYYGGRGITVCDRWGGFSNFLEDMGEAPKNMEIDRIDNQKGYSKENCRWATRTENTRNRRNVVRVNYDGENITLVELAEKIGVPYHAIRRRICQWGMEVDVAVLACKNLRRVGVNKKHGKKKTRNAFVGN